MKPYTLGALAFGLSSVSGHALAQTRVLDQVIVTTNKQEEDLSKVPVTVNAFTEIAIQEAGIEDLEDVARLTPALRVGYASSQFGSRISIRGIGTQQTDPALEPSVGLFVDGVFLGRSGLGLSDLTDIERIEVLQGPQGTLYGKNANAGAVSITTKKPSMDETEGYLDVTVGDYNLRQVTGSVSLPLTDKLALRLGGNVKKRDGFYNNAGGEDLSNANDWNMQGKLFWEPTENLSVLFSLSHVEDDSTCCGSESAVSAATNAFLVASGFDADANDLTDYEVAVNFDSAFTLDSDMAYLNVDYQTDFGTFTSITAWDDYVYSSSFDPDRTQLDVLEVTDNSGGDSFSQELRFNSNVGSDFDYLVGAFYLDQHIRRGDGNTFVVAGVDFIPVGTAQGLPLPAPLGFTLAPGDIILIESTIDTETLALFGQGTWHFGDRYHLTGGLRYSDESKDASLYNETVSTAPSTALGFSLLDGFVTPIDADLSRSSDSVDWLVRFSADINDRSIAFASASTGTKSGGINTSTGGPSDREFDDEHTTNYEVGIKYITADQKLRANATAFYTVVDDFQFQTQLPSGAGLFVSNDAQIEVSGLDVQFETVVNDYLAFSGGVLYMSSYEVTEGVNTGDPLLYTADWNYNLGAAVNYPFADGELYWRTDYNYVGDHQVTRIMQSQSVLNSRLGWRNGDWDVALWGRNLTDDVYAIEAPDAFAFTGTLANNLAAPATYGVSVRREF